MYREQSYIIILLLFLNFGFSKADAFSYNEGNYNDNICVARTAFIENFKSDLTAKVQQDSLDYSMLYSEFEVNAHALKEPFSELAAMCKFGSDGLDIEACKVIFQVTKYWAEQEYLTARSTYDSADWWEEALQSSIFMQAMFEGLIVADEKLDGQISDNQNIVSWISNAIRKNSKYSVAKNNHRTAWVIAAMKSTMISKKPIKIGFSEKNFVELGDLELNYQFNKMMNKDGALKEEAVRGTRAIFYTGRQLGNLLSILEMMEASGNSRYTEYEDKLHLAVSFFINAIDDPKVIYPYSKKMKHSPKGDPMKQDYGNGIGERLGTFSFTKIYVSQFPSHENSQRIKMHPLLSPYVEDDTGIITGFGLDVGCLNPNPTLQLVKSYIPKPEGAEKYDRTEAGLNERFSCFIDYAKNNGINLIPNENEIANFINNIVGNTYYRSHRQIIKLGLPKEFVNDNKPAILRLVNFEGTNEEYCQAPVLE